MASYYVIALYKLPFTYLLTSTQLVPMNEVGAVPKWSTCTVGLRGTWHTAQSYHRHVLTAGYAKLITPPPRFRRVIPLL